MKKLLLILLCLPFIGFGQTYVPDDNFEAWIETTYPLADNGAVNDNYVLTAGLDFSTSSININQGNTPGPIFDLTGIEDFIVGYNLQINNLLITQLDLTDFKFNNFQGINSFQLTFQNNQYLEEIILPDSDDTISVSIMNNDSLSNIVFQPGLSYSNISISDADNLCELILKGKFSGNSWTAFSLTSSYSITTIDFSGITEAPYQTVIYFGSLWSYDASFGILPSNLQQINFNGPISIYNWLWNGTTDFGNPTWQAYHNYIPCIEVPSSSDASYCAGSNEWPDSVTYSTNCYTPTNCQAATSIIEAIPDTRDLIKIIDILGRETKGTKNELLFYIYDDGTVEKRIVIK